MVFIDILTLIIIIGVISQILGASKKKQPPQRQGGQPQPGQRLKELLTEAQQKERQAGPAKRARADEHRRAQEQGRYPQAQRPLKQAQPRAAAPQTLFKTDKRQSMMMPPLERSQAAGLSSQAAESKPLEVIKESEGRVVALSLAREDIIQGLVMAEVLGKPKALKRQVRY